MTSIKELYQITDYPVIILGGGSNLFNDALNAAHVTWVDGRGGNYAIGVNEHWIKLGVDKLDFLVFNDSPKKYPGTKEAWENKGEAKVISKLPDYTDYSIDVKHFHRGESGMLAAWLGCYITSGLVYLCGFDCYSTPNHYYSGKPNLAHNSQRPLSNHLRRWERAKVELDGWERLRVMSGPLKEIFK